MAASTPFDTIIAPITGVRGAVAVVRMSGPDSWRIAGAIFSPWQPEPLRVRHGRYLHGDDGLATPFEEGHSYTGEESVELSLHGSWASVAQLLDACVGAGARLAEPGEFTQRAFLNGRIDLTQAEGIRDAIEAKSAAQLRLANLQKEGSLRTRLERMMDQVGGVLAAVEASIDFSEEIGEFDSKAAIQNLSFALHEVRELRATANVGRVLRQGLRVAIVGQPNSGKSSLLNAILGIDRAIVTESPGTTRDYVEEQISVSGFPVVLIDTAGLREPKDAAESIGIQRSRTIGTQADHVWYVYDASQGWSNDDESFLASFDRPTTIVANKADLASGSVGVAISATKRQGLAELLQTLPFSEEAMSREFAINLRHAPLLESAEEHLRGAIESLEANRPADLISVLLQSALHDLGQVTGVTASPDMVSRIFADFCIGK